MNMALIHLPFFTWDWISAEYESRTICRNFWINLGHQLIRKIDDKGGTDYTNGSGKLLSLNPKIGHQAALTWTQRIIAFCKICHKECINIQGLGICNTWRIYWKKNGKNDLNTRLMHASISLDIVYLKLSM